MFIIRDMAFFQWLWLRRLGYCLITAGLFVSAVSLCSLCCCCICWTVIGHKVPTCISLRNYRVSQKNRTCLSIDNSAMVTHVKACDMSKVLECCRQKGPNLHNKSFKYFLRNLPKSSIPLKLGICLHSHVPEFIELKNSLPKSPDLNSVNYSVCAHCNR